MADSAHSLFIQDEHADVNELVDEAKERIEHAEERSARDEAGGDERSAREACIVQLFVRTSAW